MQTYTYIFQITFLMKFMLVHTPKQKLFEYICNRFRNGHYNNIKYHYNYSLKSKIKPYDQRILHLSSVIDKETCILKKG